MIAAQVVDSGFNLASILGIGGPAGIAGALLVFLSKMWIDRRRENREDRKTDRESESVIVKTTSDLTNLVREQMLDMARRMGEMEAENKTLRADILTMRADHAVEISKLREQVTGLQIDNENLRRDRL